MNNSSSNLVNYTPCPYDISAVFTSVLAVLSLAAIIGNILVMSAVYKTPNLRTSTNYYYVNMAVSDFLSSLTLWPLYLTDEIITQRGSLIQGLVATIGCKVGVFTRNVSHSVSILSLFLIAVDRFIATVHPLKVTLLTKNIRASLLLSTWIIAIGGSFITFLHSRVKRYPLPHSKLTSAKWSQWHLKCSNCAGLIKNFRKAPRSLRTSGFCLAYAQIMSGENRCRSRSRS